MVERIREVVGSISDLTHLCDEFHELVQKNVIFCSEGSDDSFPGVQKLSPRKDLEALERYFIVLTGCSARR
jgi:hypothetical protein